MACRSGRGHTETMPLSLSIVLTALFLISPVRAAFLGSVREVSNLPGYIDTDRKSATFQGVVSTKNRNDQIEWRTPSELITSLFEGQELSVQKIRTLMAQLSGYRANAYLFACNSEVKETTVTACDQNAGFQKKWTKDAHKRAIDFALSNLENVLSNRQSIRLAEINSVANQPWIEKIFSAIEIWEAVKSEDRQRGAHSESMNSIKKMKRISETSSISAQGPDAANLLVPNDHPLFGIQKFLSERDLAEMKTQGRDVSLLNPPSSGMWRKSEKSIRRFDTANYDGTGLSQLRKLYSEKEARALVNPDEPISVVYKEHALSGGRTPKFNVKYGDHKWKVKFITDRRGVSGAVNMVEEMDKQLRGSEANIEPAVNNLAASLGYTVDPTYFKKSIRIYFEKSVYDRGEFDAAAERMKKHLASRYGRVNLRSALGISKIDEAGRKYIEMKSVSLEQKGHVDTDQNIGFFDRSGLGKDLAREHRAFFLFSALIADRDIKNENDKVKIVPEGNTLKVMHSNSDMGGSLGAGYPNLFEQKLIRKVSRNSKGEVELITFNYVRAFPYPIQEAVNLNDAKWFGRLLGQLSLDQFERAFLFSGYPTVVARYYALVMAGKRNELLSTLGLIGSRFTNDQGETITLELLPEFSGTITGYEKLFKNGLLTDPQNSLYDPNYENWPRNWGVTHQTILKIPAQNEELRKVTTGDIAASLLAETKSYTGDALIHKQGGGLNLSDTKIVQHHLNTRDEGNYFLEGGDFGIRNFVPHRVLLPNPNLKDDPTNLLWMVDIVRLGFFVGDRGEILQGLLGIDPPTGLKLGLGNRFFKIVEVIKITPVPGAQEFVKSTKNFLELPRYALPSLREDLVGKLKENQTLIVSSYLGMEAAARVRVPLASFGFLGVRLGASLQKVKRMTLHSRDATTLVNFSKERTAEVGLRLNALELFLSLPLARDERRATKKIEATFLFDKSAESQAILMEQLKKPQIENIPAKFSWENRFSRGRDRTTSVSALGLRTSKRSVHKLKTDYQNFLQSTEAHTRKLSIKVEKKRLRDIETAVWERQADVLVDQAGGLAVSLAFNLSYPGATKEKLLQIISRYRPYFPKALFFFDTAYLKHYMGHVKARSRILFTHDQLALIFSENFDSSRVCSVLKESNLRGCEESFFSDYDQARRHFRSLSKQTFEARYSTMKRVAAFFLEDNGRNALEFAKSVITAPKMIEAGSIESDLAAFPGDHEATEVSTNEDLLIAHDSGTGLSPELFSDSILSRLRDVFFSSTP